MVSFYYSNVQHSLTIKPIKNYRNWLKLARITVNRDTHVFLWTTV